VIAPPSSETREISTVQRCEFRDGASGNDVRIHPVAPERTTTTPEVN
jgi:hypothetical protein